MGKISDPHEEALRYLDRAERSCFQMRKHLLEKEFSEEEADETIETMKACHYLDDERFCEHYIEYAAGKGKGPFRIRPELAEKGIGSEISGPKLEECYSDEDQFQTALRAAKKCLGIYGDEPFPKPDQSKIAKVQRRLSTLGHKGSIIYRVIGELKQLGGLE